MNGRYNICGMFFFLIKIAFSFDNNKKMFSQHEIQWYTQKDFNLKNNSPL